jgi:hypothetical protein
LDRSSSELECELGEVVEEPERERGSECGSLVGIEESEVDMGCLLRGSDLILGAVIRGSGSNISRSLSLGRVRLVCLMETIVMSDGCHLIFRSWLTC